MRELFAWCIAFGFFGLWTAAEYDYARVKKELVITRTDALREGARIQALKPCAKSWKDLFQ